MYTKDIGPEVGKTKTWIWSDKFYYHIWKKNGYIRKNGYLPIAQNQKD